MVINIIKKQKNLESKKKKETMGIWIRGGKQL